MLWYLPWSENIKKRACRYLLQRYLGNFLEEKLTLDQLSVDLYNGTGTVSDVSLDCEALNELGDTQNWPLDIVDGYMQEITVTIPWSTLLKDDSVVEVNGLSLTVQPKVRQDPVPSMLESMWSSMSSSMQLAAECLREEDGPQESNPVEGIEMFAHTIDSILSRVKVKFVNTKIRLEHVPKNGDRGIAIEIHIQKIDYFDEAGVEPTPDVTDPDKPKTYLVATYTNKKIRFEGVTFYTDEFPSKLRTMARSLIMEKSVTSQADKSDTPAEDANYASTTSDVFYETRSVFSTIDSEPIKKVVPKIKTHIEIREATPEELASQPDPILFAKLTGQQELALKIKHSEEVEGPKVEVKMLFGSLIVFISPRQLHTLVELVDALYKPQLEDTSNIPLRPSNVNVQCKPMRQADYQLIEAQLLGNLERYHSKPSSSKYGWSGPSYDESDNESEKFHPMTSPGANMAESFSTSVSSMSTSMTSSVNIPTTQPRIKRNRKVPHIDGDPTAEVSHISFRVASVSCILLHKDILSTTPQGAECISPASATKLHEISKEFFDKIAPFTVLDEAKREFSVANNAIDSATKLDHLRLLTSEVTIDGSDKRTSNGSQTVCEASIGSLLVRECLYSQDENRKPQGFDLISFKQAEDAEKKATRANIKINFKQTSKYIRIAGEKKLTNPTTDILMKCTPFHVDVDLTLIDRMAAIFHGIPAPSNVAPTAASPPQNQFNYSMQCSDLNAILRFPVADLRPNVNRDIRRVRPDYLEFEFQNITLSSQQTPSARPLPTTVTLKATSMDLFYHENDSLPPTHIARSTMSDPMEGNILTGNPGASPLPTISLTFKPQQNKGLFDSVMDEVPLEPAVSNPMTTSMYMMKNLQSSVPSPFSGKKMAHQSVTKHENDTSCQEEELIVPGSEEEMAEFTSNAVEHSSIHLELNLPILSLQLESKQLYEILYNRINSDLLLWEPLCLDPFEISPLMTQSIYPAFEVCKGTGYDSESESSSSEEENLYYSTYDNRIKKNLAANKQLYETKDTHDFSLTLAVNKGLLTIYAPVRDSNKHVVPGQMGELVLEARKLSMCQVSGLNGQPKTAQLCLRAGKMTLYHDSSITIPSEKPCLRLYGTNLPSHLKNTIYPSNKGVLVKDHLQNKDMFSLALKVSPDRETPKLKTICIALGIEQATLRHRGDKGIAWLTQLMDVLDVLDYPVPGYTPSTVLSELHVHVWDCSVDYRPLYLPIRSVVTLGQFSLSSNLIAETNTSCLRFLVQECTLFLYYVHNTKPHVPVPTDEDKHPNLNKDYVCVVDLGLFELSLRMNEKTNGTSEGPQTDLSASNNIVNLYTCWDSASALCRLLTYIASDGDCQPPFDPSSRHTSICSDQPLEQLVGLDDRPSEEVQELSPSEMQQVNELMEEAMKESPNTTLEEDDLNSSTEKDGVEVFFFPDEQKRSEPQVEVEKEPKSLEFDEFHIGVEEAMEARPCNAHVVKDLGDPTSTPKASPQKPRRRKFRKQPKSSGEGNNTDDEYCIIDSQFAEEDDDIADPKTTWLDGGQQPVAENYFHVPAARADVLQAPKSFPSPVTRYTLCEMSVAWTIYGGTDFRQQSDPSPAKKSVTIEDPRKQGSPSISKRNKDYEPYETTRSLSGGVSYSAGTERARAHTRASPRRDLRERGGPARDHSTSVKICLNKVKFVHETYPSSGKHASRHTLAIHKVEVIDQLEISDINKMLSHYQLKDEPERKHAHMLVVKLVYLRPDPSRSAQECCVKVSLLPLRFNLDQDTLAFVVGYFSKLGTDENCDDDSKSVGGLSTDSSSSRQTTPTHKAPVMSIASHLRDPPPTPTSLGDADALSLNETAIRNGDPLMELYEAERMVSENLIYLEEDFQRLGTSKEKPTAKPVDNEPIDDSPVYFRRVVFSPEVPIRLDYVGKRVDLSAGPVAGLLMGLGQLNCSELTLKRLDYRLGLLGLEKLVQWAMQEWLSDIKRHQLPGLLSGIGPMHSLLQLITGIRDLVWLPVEQWRRDGRLVHGLRRGAASFTARTAVAALDITTRLLHLIQATAETAFDMLTPGPTLQLQAAYDSRRRRRRRDPSKHPTDIREGVATAFQTVREGFAETAATMALAARHESGVGVLRHLPGAAVTPLVLAAAGAADVLGGVRAHLAPHRARDHADKYRSHPPDSAE